MAEPFKFYECIPLVKLTGRKTDNPVVLLQILQDISEESIFHHMHQYFIRSHTQMVYHNDFAVWADQALRDKILSERLANINPFSLSNTAEVREELIRNITEHLKEFPSSRKVLPGDEFFFNEGVTLVMSSGHEAATLEEFYKAVKEVDQSSIYFHFYEGRLRLGKERDDFSLFLRECLESHDVADRISSLDPYMYSTDVLRKRLLKIMEPALK